MMRSLISRPAFALAVLAATGCAGSGMPAPPPSPHAGPEQAASHPSPTVVAEAPKPASDAAPGATPEEAIEPVAVPVEGTEFVRGRSTVKVKAPLDTVREAVLDFPHYAEFMPHYRGCKVLGRTATGARDVYMEVEALFGAVKMWAEIEMPKPTTVDGVEVHETRFLKGNVKEFKAIWRLRRLDDQTTELSLEVFLQPSIPMPTKLINDENLKGSAKGVAAMREHAEKAAPKP